jgi:hypothetical protein
VNEAVYPWHGLADVKLERDSGAVTIASAGRLFRYHVFAQSGLTSCSTDPDESKAW